jgi:hypothetical protein
MNWIWSGLSRRSVRIVFLAFFVSIAAEATVVEVVGASGAPPAVSVSPHGNLNDGQNVSVSVGPNSYFTPHAGVNILECADPGGSAANLPKDITTCDGNTIQGSTILVAADGSFSVPTYPVYALPSSTLGEQANYKPICNQTNPCVLYVGQNQNDFTAPKVFSAPLTIAAGSGTATSTTATTAAPAGTSLTGSSGSTSTTAAPTTSSAPTVATATATGALSQSTASTSGALANTGPPAEIVWVVVSGMALLLTGAMGRRLSLRRSR